MKPLALLLAAMLAAPAAPESPDAPDPYRAARRAMIAVVQHDLERIRGDAPPGRSADAALKALAAVPRHEFVPASGREAAYANRPLPIGHGQTISQPTIVALMTMLLDVGPGPRVLELGTGSGYQAAVLAELGVRVYTIEIVPALGESARARLARLGYAEVAVRIGDGYSGWPEAAPFDAIIVTAAANHIPPPLLEQLRPGGRLVIPVGNPFGAQHLTVATRDAHGRVRTQKILPVRFVPLTGRAQR